MGRPSRPATSSWISIPTCTRKSSPREIAPPPGPPTYSYILGYEDPRLYWQDGWCYTANICEHHPQGISATAFCTLDGHERIVQGADVVKNIMPTGTTPETIDIITYDARLHGGAVAPLPGEMDFSGCPLHRTGNSLLASVRQGDFDSEDATDRVFRAVSLPRRPRHGEVATGIGIHKNNSVVMTFGDNDTSVWWPDSDRGRGGASMLVTADDLAFVTREFPTSIAVCVATTNSSPHRYGPTGERSRIPDCRRSASQDFTESAALPALRSAQIAYGCDHLGLYESGSYGYRSGQNPQMVAHLTAKADELSESLMSGDAVLDIGANDGTLLNGFRSTEPHRIRPHVAPVAGLFPTRRGDEHGTVLVQGVPGEVPEGQGHHLAVDALRSGRPGRLRTPGSRMPDR